MQGTYMMLSQTLNDGTKDTRYASLKQLKTYSDDFFMYTQVNPDDSVSSFGVGSYNIDSGKVVENVIYSSADSTFSDAPVTYRLDITKTPDGYTQVIPEIVTRGQKYKLTEEYNKVGTDVKSPLDGVWKETKSFVIRGADSIVNNRTQYKSYNNGYFMFGQTVKDSTGKNHTGIGFGTFVMNGDNQAKETDLNSTYAIIAGNTFTVDLQMDGPDKYYQMINNADGTKGLEYYERLKK
ncbi:MAG: hypothetical protein ABIN25_12890 [Ginsengibacter sp.]